MPRTFSSLASVARRFRADRSGLAATEFAIILPMMLVLFFGTLELSNGVAADRKVTLVARTLSDLTSQPNVGLPSGSPSNAIFPTDLANSFGASSLIMQPYYTTPAVQQIISQVLVDASGNAWIVWSRAQNATANTCGAPVSLPSGLAVPNTYLIYGQASYTYTPVVGYVMKTSVTLTDQFFTRPRQSTCMLLCTTDGSASSCQTSCPTTQPTSCP
jgi:Flp pilus assembly protein TadG